MDKVVVGSGQGVYRCHFKVKFQKYNFSYMSLSIKRLEILRTISRFIKTSKYFKILDNLCSKDPDDTCHGRTCSFLSFQIVFT